MTSKKKTTILISSLAVIACAGAGIGIGTYALFSDQAKITNHLVGGDLDLTLKRERLDYTYIDSEGIQKVASNTEIKDFSAPTSENVFDFTTTDKFIPTSYREATMVLSNTSSVAYDWYMSIKLDASSSTSALSDQLYLQVDTDLETEGYEYQAYLSAGLDVGSAASPVGTVKINNTKKFKVKISFPDASGNNAAQGLDVDFDLTVSAVQHTGN